MTVEQLHLSLTGATRVREAAEREETAIATELLVAQLLPIFQAAPTLVGVAFEEIPGSCSASLSGIYKQDLEEPGIEPQIGDVFVFSIECCYALDPNARRGTDRSLAHGQILREKIIDSLGRPIRRLGEKASS